MESSEGIFHVLRRNIPTGGKFYIVYRWYVEIFPYINTVKRQKYILIGRLCLLHKTHLKNKKWLMCKYLSKLPEIYYHGTSSFADEYLSLKDIKRISIERCNRSTDFSQGFYLTSVYIQSFAFARRAANRFNKDKKFRNGITPKIIKYRLNIKKISVLNEKFFPYPDSKWGEFVYNNRMEDNRYVHSNFHNINKEYDYVYGHLADGKIAEIIDSYKEDYSLSTDIIESFTEKIFPRFPYNNDQLSLHTQRAVSCLEFLEVIDDEKYDPSYKR